MNIIETDGQSNEPLTVDSLQIFAAQRYSFVLNANQPVGNYWIRANPNLPSVAGFTGGINSAILRYKGAPNEEPAAPGAQPNANFLNENKLRSPKPVPGKPVPGGADHVLNMTIGFNADGNFTMNGTPFVSPTTPVLLQILSGAQSPQDLLPSKSIYPLPKNKVIEINFSLSSTVGAPHPMHLHGVSFPR